MKFNDAIFLVTIWCYLSTTDEFMPIAVLFMHFHYDTKQGLPISVLHLTHSKRIDNIVWLCSLQVGLFHFSID